MGMFASGVGPFSAEAWRHNHPRALRIHDCEGRNETCKVQSTRDADDNSDILLKLSHISNV